MKKVTITVETAEQLVSVTRQHDKHSAAQLFAEAIWRVADTMHADELEFIAQAVADAVRKRGVRRD